MTVLWIPGYRSIKDNTIVDRLAKLAANQNATGPEPSIGISNRSVTEDISKWLAEDHQKEWHRATVCTLLKNPM